MDVRSYSDVRANLKEAMDTAIDDRVPLLITRRRGGHAVLIAKEEWDSIAETLHLTSTAANTARLNEAIAAADAGDLEEYDPTR